MKTLYSGPQEGALYESMSKCDATGPLVVYISKLTAGENNMFWAVGRGSICLVVLLLLILFQFFLVLL